MATLTTLLADLNDRLNDASNTQITEAIKIGYINAGINATWPNLYKIVRDSSTELVADTWEYALPSAVGNNSKVLRVEVETEAASSRFIQLWDYQIIPGITDPILLLEHSSLPSEEGAAIRFTVATHLTALVSGSDTYDGPKGTEELPVLYAMGVATNRRLDDRLDHRRYSTTVNENHVSPDQIMTASQFYFAQFELLLERLAMPLPSDQG